MNLKCLVGMHEWSGCTCPKCGKTRDQNHDWTSDCEKCAQCGIKRTSAHTWTGCKCTKCGKTRDEWHEWTGDFKKCSRCGVPVPFALIQSEDVLKIRQIIDIIAVHSRCIETSGWDRAYGDYKSADDLAKLHPFVDLDEIFTPQGLSQAEKLGLDRDLLTNAAQAFCFHKSNRQVGQDTWRDQVSTIVGDDAIDKLCRIKTLLSSYILFRVATMKPITVTLSACIGSEEYTFDFAKRAERAHMELKKRGFAERDPLGVAY